MKKPTLKRVAGGIVQHLLAAMIMIAVSGLLLNSYIAVDSIDGTRVYRILSADVRQKFENSDIYNDLFRNAVSDITQLVVIKGLLETDGVFDPQKHIDVTEYAGQLGKDRGCGATVLYELDDLIKWGKRGVGYSDRVMSMSDFVNYFGSCIYPENFDLDEYGQLVFRGFYKVADDGTDALLSQGSGQDAGGGTDAGGSDVNRGTGMGNGAGSEGLAQGGSRHSVDETAFAEEMARYSRGQLEDMVFSYLMSKDLDQVHLSREDDGSLTVSFPMLNCRYDTVDGSRQLTDCVDNWVDYFYLQENTAAAIESLTRNYERYQICNPAYGEGKSNVKYMVRLMTQEGIVTYTNLPDIKELSDEDVTEYFSEYRRYLIYYPDSLVFMGNTAMSEEEIYGYINLYEYAYPDTTHIWLAVDTEYNAQEDAFYNVHRIYEKVIPNMNRIIGAIAFMALVWLGIAVHMSLTAGEASDEDGNRIRYLTRFDRIWTEVFCLLAAGLIYAGIWGARLLMEIAQTAGVVPRQMLGIQLTKLYHYGIFGLYGVCVSASVCLIWYSLIRRIKSWNFWKDSFLNCLLRRLGKSMRFVFRHKNSVISTILPYNVFLFVNLAGIAAAYHLRQYRAAPYLAGASVILFDCIVGVLLFRKNAEQNEIVDGISRIRNGEVDFVLETEALHGSNRELADAVNNIGEGIRAAVQTSMKDEQMKTDLITNVSHDIKTPLTSIINYIDLLKRLKIEEEPAKGYINILDGKAQRLKQLTDDLVEVSKISSGNIELNREKLNLTELLNQSLGEFSEKLEEKKLKVVLGNLSAPAYIYADSRRMWRIVENLFNNICKYALEGTRVYIDMTYADGKIAVAFKNISRQQMNIRPEELTERFIRGDSSRSTEGSGLGLSIARNLVQVQGGTFEILLDGDLFKVVVAFPEYRE